MYYLPFTVNQLPNPRHHPWYTSLRRRASYWQYRCGYLCSKHCTLTLYRRTLNHCPSQAASQERWSNTDHPAKKISLCWAAIPALTLFQGLWETPMRQSSCRRTQVPVHGSSFCSSKAILLAALSAHAKALCIPGIENRGLFPGQASIEMET